MNAAITCFNTQEPAGDHTVVLANDITIDDPAGPTAITGVDATNTLTIDGTGFALLGSELDDSAALLSLAGPAVVQVTNLEVSQSGGIGVQVDGGQVALDAVTISGAGFDGLVVLGGSVTVSSSFIVENGDDGVYINEVTAAVNISGTTVGANEDNGVLIDAGQLTISESSVQANADDGIDVRNRADVTLTGVDVIDNGDDGIDVGAGTIEIVGGSSTNNAGNGVVINDNTVSASLASATVSGNGEVGVVIDGRDLTISDTTISDNGTDGIFMAGGSLELAAVQIINNNDNGLIIEGGVVNVHTSVVSNNVDDGFDIRDQAVVTVTSSSITGQGDDGFDITDATVEITSSLIAENGDDGVGVFGVSTVAVIASSVTASGDDGVDLRGESVAALISNSSIWNSGDDGVRAAGDGVTVANSTITASSVDAEGADITGAATLWSTVATTCPEAIDADANVGGCFGTVAVEVLPVIPETCAVTTAMIGADGEIAQQCMPILTIETGSNAVGAGGCTAVPVGLDEAGAVVIGNLIVDQRGAPRPAENPCDAGAFETQTAQLVIVQTLPASVVADAPWTFVVSTAAGCLTETPTDSSIDVVIAAAGGESTPIELSVDCIVTISQNPQGGFSTSEPSQDVAMTADQTVSFASEPTRSLRVTKTIVTNPSLGLDHGDDFWFTSPELGVFVLDAPVTADADVVVDTILFEGLDAADYLIIEEPMSGWLQTSFTCEGAATVQDAVDSFGRIITLDNLATDATCVVVNTSDVDNDGITDVDDLDNDNDGQSDLDEDTCGSDKLDALSVSPDHDENGVPDCLDVETIECGGYEILITASGDYSAPGFDGTLIVGTSWSDHLVGTYGPDLILGLGGNDYIVAGFGDDVVCGGEGHDVIGGHRGDDYLHGGAGSDAIYGSQGNDVISGGSGSDVLFGGSGHDELSGGAEADRLYGGSGNDDLDGGDDRDRCRGGSGSDTQTNCEQRRTNRNRNRCW